MKMMTIATTLVSIGFALSAGPVFADSDSPNNPGEPAAVGKNAKDSKMGMTKHAKTAKRSDKCASPTSANMQDCKMKDVYGTGSGGDGGWGGSGGGPGGGGSR